MKKMMMTACALMLVAIGMQAQTGDKVTSEVLSYYYFCNTADGTGALEFWMAGDQLVVQENWGSEDGYDGGTAYLCEVSDGQLRAVKSCEVEMAQWDGIVDEKGQAKWNDVKDYFQSVTPFIIKYNASAKTLTVKRHTFKRDEKNVEVPDFSKVKGLASTATPQGGSNANGGGVEEAQPEFPGGSDALMTYLARSVRYPVDAMENGIQGKVIVSFVVKTDGSLTDVKVARSVHPSLDAEAVRVVKAMPKWKPGIQNGKPVNVHFMVPVIFRMR